MIPLGTDRPNRRPTLMTYVLIAANVAVFVAQVGFAKANGGSVFYAIPELVLETGVSGWWTYLTYAFLHAGIGHLFFNMLFLFVFGPNVEDRFGRIGFTVFYLFGGVAAGLVFAFFKTGMVVGASGAVAAVTGAFLVLFPLTHVRLLLFFFIIGVYSIPSWWLIVFAIVRDFVPFTFLSGSNVAHSAHLGGYAFGMSVSLFLLATRLVSREPYDLFSMAKHRHRRRKFFEAARQAEAKSNRVSSSRIMSKSEERAAHKLAEARAAVSDAITADDLDAAADAYRGLLGEFGHDSSATTLNRAHMLSLANHLFKSDDHQTAAIAYERFLASNPNDAEAPGVRLLLGLINARHLNDPVRAKELLGQARGRLRSDAEEDLAKQLIEELG